MVKQQGKKAKNLSTKILSQVRHSLKSSHSLLVYFLTTLGIAATLPVGAVSINLNAGNNLSSNQAALDAFQRAANQWEQFLLDPVTVNIDADLSSNFSDPNIIGAASSVILEGGYTGIRDAVVADASLESDDTIATFLPTVDQASFIFPSGFSFSGNLTANKANLKALGFTGLDNQFGNTDATITFNSDFDFDFDNSDGVDSGKTDFETVAAHEIGHALGFTSIVDFIDNNINNPQPVSPRLLDLFRFDADGQNPSTQTEFTTFARDLRPGSETVFDDIDNEYAFSTGVNSGDGKQASHWKADELTGNFIGIMDPTIASGQVYPITQADLRTFDLMGYDTNLQAQPVPEPLSIIGTIAALGFGSFFKWKYRKKA